MSIFTPVETQAKALNDYLKGCHMAVSVTETLLEKSENSKVRVFLTDLLKLYKDHEVKAILRITELHEKPVDTKGILGAASEIFYDLKTINIDTDSEIIEETKKVIKTGIIMVEKFLDEHGDCLDETSIELIQLNLKEEENFLNKLSEEIF